MSETLARNIRCTVASIALMAASTSVQAQETEGTGAKSAVSVSSDSDEGVPVITVTAQKREQNLQKAPAAIAVLSAEDLVTQGISDIRAVQFSVPGVRFNRNQDKAQLFIRGVGIATDRIGLDAAVAMNLADVILPREGTGAALFDVDRIEVLKGPQGTIYGSNAAGGVVNVTPTKPGNNFDGYLAAEYGNYDTKHVWGAQNIRVSDTLSLRLAGDVLVHDGYASNGFDDQKSRAGRVSAIWEPSNAISIYGWGQYYKNTGLGDNAYRQPRRNAADAWYSPIDTALAPANPTLIAQGRLNESIAAGLNIRLELGSVELTYIPGYAHERINEHLLLDVQAVTPGGIRRGLISSNRERTQWTHEVRLSGANKSDAFQWLLGAYYYQQVNNEVSFTPGGPATDIPRQGNHNKAVFGRGTYSITPTLRITAGLRYTKDSKDARGNRFGGAPTFTSIPFDVSYEGDNVDFQAGIEADIGDNTLAYANISTGYLGGAISFFNSTAVPNTIRPEKLLAYQAGIKNTLFDKRMTLNLEGFYYDYKDYQVALFSAQAGTQVIYNAPKSRIFGAELDSRISLSDHDNLSITASYVNAKFTDFILPVGVSSPVRAYNFNGFALPWTPRFTAAVSYSHEFDLGSAGALVFSVQSQYSSSYWTTFSHGITQCQNVPAAVLTQDQCINPDQRQTDYVTSTADLTYSPNNRFSLSFWIRNLENTAIIGSGAEGALSATGARTSYPVGQLHPPRTYGVRARVSW